MDCFIINGGRRVKGSVKISGSKNAALPILFATLLTDEKCEVSNVPDLADIKSTMNLLLYIGKICGHEDGIFTVSEEEPLKTRAPYELVRKMRASVLAAGPLLARFGKARFAMPGGCSIGVRPIDIHLEGLKQMGAEISYEDGDVVLNAGRLRPAVIPLHFPSVGATENIMMCASLVEGETVIKNAAREPEITDLAKALSSMGAEISGAGTSVLRVGGRARLGAVNYRVMPDRIETGSYMLVCAAAGGELRLTDAAPDTLTVFSDALRQAGAKISASGSEITIRAPEGRPAPVNVTTSPYPGFPTDLQAPWLSFVTMADGECEVREEIFENRFMHVPELMRMGADISVSGRKASVRGVPELHGAPVMASDLRAGMALIVAAAAAKGKTFIRRVYHIDRGYEKIEEKLRAVGIDIKRTRE